MAHIVKPNTDEEAGWARQTVANLVWWQRDLSSGQYGLFLVCTVAFAGFGVSFLWRGLQALRQGKEWASLIATGNLRLPYISVGREILSGSAIVALCTVLLSFLIAARCGRLNHGIEE